MVHQKAVINIAIGRVEVGSDSYGRCWIVWNPPLSMKRLVI